MAIKIDSSKYHKMRVRSFNSVKGYGFLTALDLDIKDDIYVHYSNIRMQGYKTLFPEQIVYAKLAERRDESSGVITYFAHDVNTTEPSSK